MHHLVFGINFLISSASLSGQSLYFTLYDMVVYHLKVSLSPLSFTLILSLFHTGF